MRVTRVEMQSTSTTAIGSGDCAVTFHLKEGDGVGESPLSLIPDSVHNAIVEWLDESLEEAGADATVEPSRTTTRSG